MPVALLGLIEESVDKGKIALFPQSLQAVAVAVAPMVLQQPMVVPVVVPVPVQLITTTQALEFLVRVTMVEWSTYLQQMDATVLAVVVPTQSEDQPRLTLRTEPSLVPLVLVDRASFGQ